MLIVTAIQQPTPPGSWGDDRATRLLSLNNAIHAALAPIIEQHGLLGFIAIAATEDSLVYVSDLADEDRAALLEEALDVFQAEPVQHETITVQ